MRAGKRAYSIAFVRAAVTTDEYNASVENWASPTTLVTVTAQVTFGTAQEKREAAQQSASQAASFECLRSPTLDAVTMKDRVSFDGSQWNLTERAPLDRQTIRFTGLRLID